LAVSDIVLNEEKMNIVTRLLNATIVAPAGSLRGASRAGMDKDILLFAYYTHAAHIPIYLGYNIPVICTFLELSALNVDIFILMAVSNPPLIVVLCLYIIRLSKKKRNSNSLSSFRMLILGSVG